MNLGERLRWAKRRVQSRGADLKKAEERRQHFADLADEWHKKWVTARKEQRHNNAERAKRKAARATRKAGWWREQIDDLTDGYDKAVERRDQIKKRIAYAKHASEAAQATSGRVVPVKPWNPYRRAVCGWFVPIIDQAREDGWRGVVVSGVRTPEESRGLCRAMCGADTCPGRCAGVNSNHNATTCQKPQGAIDVTDYYVFASCMRRRGNPIYNDLPIDRVHFSANGH